MQTDTVFACFVEVDDFIELDASVWRVTEITDTYEDRIYFDLVDDEQDSRLNGKPFAPFDPVTVVLSFEEDFSFEDVDIDA